jgi:hypothetical protein
MSALKSQVAFRDLPMVALLASKEAIEVDLAEIDQYPDHWDFPSGSAEVLRVQLAKVNAQLRRRQRIALPPIENGRPDAEDVKAQVDITLVIERYTSLRKAGRTYRGKCPVHDGVSDGSLAVYPESQSFYCFGCGIGGDVFDFLMWAAGCQSFPNAIELACIEAGIPRAIPSLPKSLGTRETWESKKRRIPRLEYVGGKVVQR